MVASPQFQVVEHESPDSYSSAARAFLIADEVVNGLPLGILEALVRDPSLYPGRRLFTVTALPPGGVASSNRVVACGHWTPPHPLCLVMNAEEGERPLISLVERVQAAGWRPAGVTGGIDVCQLFLDLWKRTTLAYETLRRRQGLYLLTEVVASFLVDDGRRLRLARTEDAPWLQEWSMEFHIDCRLATTPEACAAVLARNLAQGTRWILEDTSGHALCMAPLPDSMRKLFV